MAPMARTIRTNLFSPRSRTSVAFAGLFVAFAIGSCADEPPGAVETSTADSHQVSAEPQPDQLPLPAIMRSLERDMAAVDAGLWLENPQAVAAAAHRVAEHPSVTLEYRAAIQEELGDHFPAFVEYDQEVHDTAQLLAERAKAGAAIGELLELQHAVARGCVGCHTAFRSRLQPAMDRLRSNEP
jgi:hypothetical protein